MADATAVPGLVPGLSSQANGQGSMPTFGEFLEDTFWPEKAGLRHTTLDCYRSHARRYLMPAFGDLPLDAIDHAAVQEMLYACPTHKTATNARETLSAILGYAVNAKRLLWHNAASGSFVYPDKIAPSEPHQGVWLTDFDEITWWLLRIRERFGDSDVYRAAFLMLCFGLRKGEAFGLDGEDILFDDGVLRIRRSYTAGSHGCELHGVKNSRAARDLPIFEPVLREFHRLGFGEGPWVANRFGRRTSPRAAATKLAKWRNREGLPRLTYATMRHSFATAALRAGMNIGSLAVWLGHCDAQTTLKAYARPTAENLRKDAGVVAALLDGMSAELVALPWEELKRRRAAGSDLAPPQRLAVIKLVSDGPLSSEVEALKALAGRLEASPTPFSAVGRRRGDGLTGAFFCADASEWGCGEQPLNDPSKELEKHRRRLESKRRWHAWGKEIVIDMLIANPRATQVDMARAANVSVSSVKRVLAELKSEGAVAFVGPTKKGRWVVSDDWLAKRRHHLLL